ncbi:MAG: hypothetical protein J5I52_08280 [Saprospiraceae bacterium]|nr:hypothetical protein [Saprospiraceae bacterium]MCZ2338967.1 hypothetical protein [Chitinophagales bacterium]
MNYNELQSIIDDMFSGSYVNGGNWESKYSREDIERMLAGLFDYWKEANDESRKRIASGLAIYVGNFTNGFKDIATLALKHADKLEVKNAITPVLDKGTFSVDLLLEMQNQKHKVSEWVKEIKRLCTDSGFKTHHYDTDIELLNKSALFLLKKVENYPEL